MGNEILETKVNVCVINETTGNIVNKKEAREASDNGFINTGCADCLFKVLLFMHVSQESCTQLTMS